MNTAEQKQINKRLRRANLLSIPYYLMRIFPIQRKKIVFTTFEGTGGYSCNPRYIAEELIARGSDYQLLWLVDDLDKNFPEPIRKVKNTFFNRVYQLSTAKIWIDNTRKPLGTKKRKGQIYVQTWHGMIGPKAVGKYRGKLFPKIAEVISEKDSQMIDYMLSNSDWCTNVRPMMLLYEGEIIRTGSPRNDMLLNKRDVLYQNLRKRYGIPQDSKVILFAPTFRGGSQQGKRSIYSEIPSIEFNGLLKELQEKFGGVWYLFLRMHPQLSVQLEHMPLDTMPNKCIDVSRADDMNELLAMCDVFITDYSSSAYDAMIMKIPIFLYADDLSEYEYERGELMFDMRKLPFPCAEHHEELVSNIRSYKHAEYVQAVDESIKEFGIMEDGCAAKRVADLLEQIE
ncbi:MAG: CDP-glycerol glycerophosphotransferase family protein [Eubacteriales bacterium]